MRSCWIRGFVTDEAVKKDFIARILKETDNMTNLINDILMKIQAGSQGSGGDLLHGANGAAAYGNF